MPHRDSEYRLVGSTSAALGRPRGRSLVWRVINLLGGQLLLCIAFAEAADSQFRLGLFEETKPAAWIVTRALLLVVCVNPCTSSAL